MIRVKLVAALLAAAAVSLSAGTVFAASDAPVTNKKGIVSVNPLGLAFGALSANYEHKLNAKSSITASIQYFHYETDLLFSKWEYTTFGVAGGYRMYFKPVAMDGWFWEPNLFIGSASSESSSSFFGYTAAYEASAIMFAPGVQAGRQWVWQGGFSITLALGLSFYVVDFDDTSGLDFPWSGIGPSGQFSLGYAF